mgnify:CR=1 FL=1
MRALTTPFVGPSGTSGSFYTKPFSPKGRFVRYRAVLRSADGTRTPILRRVRVGNAVDCR